MPRYRQVGFCPRCGAAYRPADFQPSDVLFLCGACGFDFYQNPLPAAVVAATHPERAGTVLLMRRRTAPGIGLWCLPGGFVRYGEPPEMAAVREMREEVGLTVRIGRLLRASMFDYDYRGGTLCILELAYEGLILDPPPPAGHSSAEASEVVFEPAVALIEAPERLAFPTQAEVLRAL